MVRGFSCPLPVMGWSPYPDRYTGKRILDAVIEAGLELKPSRCEQFPALCRQLDLEYRTVSLDKLIKEGAIRVVVFVTDRAVALTSFPASQQFLHDWVPTMLMSAFGTR